MLQADLNPLFGMDLTDTNYVNSYTMAQDSEPSYCLCGQPYNPDIFMIQCDACKDWFHSSCTNFREWEAVQIDRYHCPRCTPIMGPSMHKPINNTHRHDYWDENANNKPVQTGTPAFVKELCSRHFPPVDEIAVKISGFDLTEQYIEANGFTNPILVENKNGLDMVMPPETFQYIDVLRLIGDQQEIDVIDVGRQNNIRMTLRDFVDYYHRGDRTRILNVVSLEFSNTGMTHVIEPPQIARTLDWANCMWPPDINGRPQVQKYCLMSVKDSYTDFHIDFGGTSVWYHVLRGEKVFFFVKPTANNLTLYSQWMTSTNQSETFFGDQVDQCFKCHLKQGQTMLIPTGWIHAVYTPEDSLVFGGNFLHSYNIPLQLSCYEIERKIKTERKFLYPNFVTINLFAAAKFLEQLVQINASGDCRCPETLLIGLKALQQAIKQWNNEKDYNMGVREQFPVDVNIAKLIKDIGKEIRHAERFINHLNPPKPERESKRKRKKPVNKDFVDYSLMSSKALNSYLPLPKSDITVVPKYSPVTPTQLTQNLKLTLPKPISFPYENSNPTKSATILYNDAPPFKSVENTGGMNFLTLPFDRPQETVAEYKGGTVLKFKLGVRDIPLITQSEISSMATNPVSTHYVEQYDNQEDQDVYDFHDDSDRDEDCFNFTIDENPPPPPKKKSIKMRLPDADPYGPSTSGTARRTIDSTSSSHSSSPATPLLSPKPRKVKKLRGTVPVSPQSDSSTSTIHVVTDSEDTSTNSNRSLVSLTQKQRKLKKRFVKSKLNSQNRIETLTTSGIESLLQASLSVPGRPHGDTSPSTSEAIAGMLSISQNWSPAKSRKYVQGPEEDVNKVHQDEDYNPYGRGTSGGRRKSPSPDSTPSYCSSTPASPIRSPLSRKVKDRSVYPSLDNSDDEDFHIFKPRGRTKVDEPWNPKARVGPLLPKMNRPAREGVKKQCVEKVLEAAAARRLNDSPDKSPKRQYHRKKLKPKLVLRTPTGTLAGNLIVRTTPTPKSAPISVPVNSPNGASTSSSSLQRAPSTGSTSSTKSSTPSTPVHAPKPRKGMKTVKQRLGKILKIHKMMH